MCNDNAIKLLAQAISEQAGAIRALEATLLGVLQAGSDSPALRESVAAVLEREYANVLAASTNPLEAEWFELIRARAMEALQAPPAG